MWTDFNFDDMKEKFELPEKWYIEVTDESREGLNKWRSCCSISSRNGTFCLSKDVETDIRGYLVINRPKNSVEISYSQFIKYVLKMKNVIGYKFKEECKVYELATIKIAGLCSCDSLKTYNDGCNFLINSIACNKIKEAGVLNLWFDEVYQEDVVLPIINGYKGERLGNDVKYGCAVLNSLVIEGIVSREKLSENRSISSIKLDSGVEITMKQLKEITNYFKSE